MGTLRFGLSFRNFSLCPGEKGDARGVYVAPAWHHGLCAMHTDDLVDQVADLAEQSARAGAAYAAPGVGLVK